MAESDDLRSANRLKAVALTAAHPGLSPEAKAILEDALEKDLDTESQRAAHDADRVVKVEAQVRVSDMIEAIADASDTVEVAVTIDKEAK